MPAFQAPLAMKRKKEDEEISSRKRFARDPHIEVPQISGGGQVVATGGEEYWMVQWRAPQQRKHKTWDGDGVLVASIAKGTLYDSEGKILGTGRVDFPLSDGKNITLGGKELELDRPINRTEFLSGLCFGRAPSFVTSEPTPSTLSTVQKRFKPLTLNSPVAHVPPSDVKKGIPLQPVDLISSSSNTPLRQVPIPPGAESSHWTANWRKKQNKKHKTWDGDAFVSLTGNKLTMITEEGKVMGSCPWNGQPLHSGYFMHIGGKEVELDTPVSASQLPNIVGADGPDSSPSNAESGPAIEDIAPPAPIISRAVPATSFYGGPSKPKVYGPLHDPKAEGAVVMKTPTKDHSKRFNKGDLVVVPVVLDPILSRRMRPHQQEGVKFLYESVMGLRKHEGQGCILADDMGLGKTLQTISLIWTLLKQNPYAGVGPTLSKVLIVCPVSLLSNWRAEFHKWLGRDRVGVVICNKDKNVVKTFLNAKTQQVLLIGYERLRTVIDQLVFCMPPIGLIICDEGHRLKSANNKTTVMFKALRTPRRIILSGTPIQNDLGEFHAMAEFCNPGLLDDYPTFRRVYEIPILRSREPDATRKESEIGEARSHQLLTIAKSFVLRRDATLMKNFLPPKHEYVVFVTPTAVQLSIFTKILHPDKLDDLVHSSTAESLAMINMLTKVSNSPILLQATADNAKEKSDANGESVRRAGLEDALKLVPSGARIDDISLSGKLVALSNLLHLIRQNTDEKCVLVSHYTSTINILEAFCKKKSYSYYRLDGQTPVAKRQEFVNAFNKSSQRNSFIFLLSSKAGGVGINLIGASRLCLIDSDWNPSHDLQSMARCHRDGQKKPVFIYRFLTAGAIDEKIYQRQVTKLGLSSALMGSGNANTKSDSFSRKDLRDIFRIHPDTGCNTHDLLDCPCDTSGGPMTDTTGDSEVELIDSEDEDMSRGFVNASRVTPGDVSRMEKEYLEKKKAGLAALGEWKHINCLHIGSRDNIHDDILRKLIHTPEGTTSKPPIEPKSRLDSLLCAVDLGNLAALDEVLSVRDVPGGTVSFLFEKTSITAVDPESPPDESRYFTASLAQ